jgi:hypothetical protein
MVLRWPACCSQCASSLRSESLAAKLSRMSKRKASADPIAHLGRAAIHYGFCFALVTVPIWLTAAITYAGPFDFAPSEFNIMDANGSLIGRSHYEVAPDGNGYAIAFGEDNLSNGEYDIERDKLELRGEDQAPRMVTFEHTFFNADGTLQRASTANFQTGIASCIQYQNGEPQAHSTVLQFPPDTFAGAAILIPLKGDLFLGQRNEIVLHDFNCVPGPEILKVRANAQPPSQWAYFPGELVRVDIKPDFGWLNFILALFVPEIHAWFSPSQDWRFVGGKFTRFYKGPEIILALMSKIVKRDGDKASDPRRAEPRLLAGRKGFGWAR